MYASETLVVNWEQAFTAGVQVVGGKGWNLARLARYGFQPPEGVVLIAAAYEQFIEHNGLRELLRSVADRISADELATDAGQQRLSALCQRVRQGSLPPDSCAAIAGALARCGLSRSPLAVRSSATLEDGQQASFAGIHDSFLNQCGMTAVCKAIAGCYASLWSERAVAYRRRMGISDYDIAPAVILMEMVPAVSAGVGFSCDPANGRPDRMLIAANFGLGESVVNGSVEPDQYLLARNGFNGEPELLEVSIGAKAHQCGVREDGGTEVSATAPLQAVRQVLHEQQINQLARLIRQVLLTLGNGEQHQDIEWAYDGSRFILLQARPVTTGTPPTYAPISNQPAFWSNANFRDAVPMVQTPFNWSASLLFLEQVFLRQYHAAGYRISSTVPRYRLFQGRPYFNLSVLQWECFDAFGLPPAEYNRFIGGHQPEISLPESEPSGSGLIRIYRNLRLMTRITRLRNRSGSCFYAFKQHVDQLLSRNLQELDNTALLRLLEDAVAPDEISDPILLMLSSSGGVFMTLQPLLERYLPGRGQALTTALLAGRQGITSADHGIRMLELANLAGRDADARALLNDPDREPHSWQQLPLRSPFKHAFQKFMDDYGHRAVYELDFGNPRWSEDPTWLLDTIRSLMPDADPEAARRRQQQTAERAWQEIRSAVPRPLHGLIRWLADIGGKDAANREMSKSLLVRLVAFYRNFARELGRRFSRQGLLERQDDIFFCYWNELRELLADQWDGSGLTARIADRQEQHRIWQQLEPPDLVLEDQPQHVVHPARQTSDGLKGLGVSAGQASGTARIIRHPDEGQMLSPGEILVAPSTDPAWTPLFLKAAALVAETGGFISHGAIVAREYGIPAVVNLPGALRLITDGQQITVDGDIGVVIIHRQ